MSTDDRKMYPCTCSDCGKESRYLSNQLKVEMFSAKNVYQNIESQDLKIEEDIRLKYA